MKLVIAVVMVVVLAVSCALARKAPESKFYSQLALAPGDAQARANPLGRDPAAVAAGKKLYARHCVDCHGVNGVDGRKGPGLLAPEVQTASPGALFWAITNGNVRAGMPVWSRLPEPQRWQIVSYLKSLGDPAAPVSGPPELGPVPGH